MLFRSMNAFALFNRVLTTKEISMLYNCPKFLSLTNSTTSSYSSYVMNKMSLMYYYPFDYDVLDYKSGLSNIGLYDISSTAVSISTSNTYLNSGSIYFPSPNASKICLNLPNNVVFSTSNVTTSFWFKFVSVPTTDIYRSFYEFYNDASSIFIRFCVGYNSPYLEFVGSIGANFTT